MLEKRLGEIKSEREERIPRQFDRYCFVTLKYSEISFWKGYKRHISCERPITDEILEQFTIFDTYSYSHTDFYVDDWTVEIQNETLANVLNRLTSYRQKIVLMYYFLGFRNREIGKILGCSEDMVSYHKMKAIRQMKRDWGRFYE